MKCKCGYEGPAEVGDFGKHPEYWFTMYWKCPKCLSTDSIVHLNPIDTIKKALLFPHICGGHREDHLPKHRDTEEVVNFLAHNKNREWIGYSIHCPICNWGQGSGISIKDFKLLVKWANENNIDNVVFHNVD